MGTSPPVGLRPCDIVMKGGITSGVAYPSAVWEISRLFTFKNVGGTSAGAIAAVITAAAQRQRLLGDDAGFDEVKKIPDDLATDNLLRRLFRPNASTKALFATITDLLGRKSKLEKFLVLYRAYALWSLAGVVPAVILLLLSVRSWPDYVLAAGLLVFLSAALAVAGLVTDTLIRLGKNYNGLVTGIADDAEGSSQPVALTSWLERRIRIAAGIEDACTPLTFAMLWDVQCAGATGLVEPPRKRDVNLEMVTTNVTFGRPFKFPFDSSQFFFKEEEMRSFFPPHVVKWMVDKRRAPNDSVEEFRFPIYAQEKIYPFPPIGDLPVIVATRMSLSFPVLLCAVPTYAADFTETSNQDKKKVAKLERCWFTDGGLSSNFPLTMFDSPVPQWPTFGINLRPFTDGFPQDKTDESKNVYLPANNQGGRLPGFNRPQGIAGFLGAIVDTMQTWHDTTQAVLPGFRDRIVTIKIANDEGGLNLDMPPDILTRLKLRGAAAGRLIAEQFAYGYGGTAAAPTKRMGWENHRWLRFRTTMGALRKYLSAAAAGANSAQPPMRTVILEHAAQSGSYQLSNAGAAADLFDESVDLGVKFSSAEFLDDNLPKPAPELVVRAPLDMKA